MVDTGSSLPFRVGEWILLLVALIVVALIITALLALGLHRFLRFVAGGVVPRDKDFVLAGMMTIVLSIFLGPSALVVAIALFLRDMRDGATVDVGSPMKPEQVI